MRSLAILIGVIAAPAFAATPALQVQVVSLEKAPLERAFDGSIEAVNQGTVSAQTSGRVVQVMYDVNDFVPAGAVIVRLRSTERKADLGQAQAQLKEAQAAAAEVKMRYARVQELLKDRVVSQQQADQVAAENTASQSKVVAAENAVSAAKEGVAYTEVRAPYAGIVSKRHVEVGESVGPGTLLMSGLSLQYLRVNVELPQSVVEKVRNLRKAALYVNGKRIEAKKITISPEASPQSNTFKTRVDLPENAADLYPGMFVKVAFVIGEAERLMIPASALVERGEITAAYVVDAISNVSLRQLRLGHRFDDRIEVLAGLRVGELIATDPIAAISHLQGDRMSSETPLLGPTLGPALGVSGRIAKFFYQNQLTPLLAVTALLMGVFAVLVTPREEEPQIDVTMANVIVPFPGASSEQVENLVSSPLEQVLGEINGVKHLYSMSNPGVAVLTVQFEVGVPRNEAIVRLYNALYSNRDWRAANVGIGEPLIKPKGIDDVPVVTLTLWTADADRGAHALAQVAHSVEAELKRVPGTRNVYTIGAPDNVVHVELDAQRLASNGLSITSLSQALQSANVVLQAGNLVGDNTVTPLQAGRFLASHDDVANLIVSARDGKPVYLAEVANITAGADQPEQSVWFGAGAAAATRNIELKGTAPAVTIAITKQPGTNAIDVTTAVLTRMEQLKGTYIPEGVSYTETRNYGATANDKAQKLIQKLMFATLSVVILVIVAMGWREAIVVGAAVVVTLAATLFASWAWGFTINRVSLFALIFSIGILVDDAIVVVENIHRHHQMGKNLRDAIPLAVDEVGGPTILATFTVIAALLPMAFVSGLMGPYMSPIPINASMGMVISLAVALVFTPWLTRKMLTKVVPQSSHANTAHADPAMTTKLSALFEKVLRPFLHPDTGRKRRHKLYFGTLAAILIAASLAGVKLVVMKMLPFDNKSEFQVALNMPEGTALEETQRVLNQLADKIKELPEVTDYQIYAGTAAPINFNGLVRQYYLRKAPELGDIQVNLVDKHDRKRKSHEIALATRPALAEIGKRYGNDVSVQVVEVPPGPPVQAPLVAEIYGPFYKTQLELAQSIRGLFDSTPDIIDVDDSRVSTAKRVVIDVDRSKAALLGVDQASIAQTLAAALNGSDVTYVHAGRERYPIPVRLELPVADKARLDNVLGMQVLSNKGALVSLSEVTQVSYTDWDGPIYHKDLMPVVYVTGDMAGKLDSPLYGMFGIIAQVDSLKEKHGNIAQHFTAQPDNPNASAIKWDGEWQITYETFRDMGLAYSVGLILIYLLVVAQFKSYFVPLIIMAPIPLTIIGVMPGHALIGAQFTATSMIGMIALAGIIVRNSILLVDFVDQQLAAGNDLADAVIAAASVRAKPIVLTGLAAMLGAFFIVDDPIFNGLAVSLIFGILVSTLLTLVLIPIAYYSYRMRVMAKM